MQRQAIRLDFLGAIPAIRYIHAKKAWDKVKKNYPESKTPDNDYPWLSFSHLPHIEALFEGKEKEENHDRQEIAIEINEL